MILSHKNLKNLLLGSCLVATALNVQADNNIDSLTFDSRNDFENFSESVTNIFNHKTLFPAEQLGLTGFDVGASVSFAQSAYKLSNQSKRDQEILPIYSLHAIKGLPGGFDVGLHYNLLADSKASSWSAEVRYALIEGGTAKPAVSLSGNYTKGSGIKALNFSSYGVDLGISKGFANLTPYAGIGLVLANVDPEVENTNTTVDLKTENLSLMKFSAGLNVNLLFMDVLVGYNQIGENATYSLKAGYRF
ncbi:hypothetical protein [Thiomicrorhabdus chilensis]|uniref:hypothetical protein n=1 Tax=Thiomicrorhabdus chilensis TaxID=63656 RepID=UPI000408959E|nr:hypothetical protein [Thiomicrorhabdus chilensis]